MKIVDFVRPELILPELSGKTKPAVLRELAQHVARHVPGVGEDTLYKVLWDREQLASTAIGEDVAIPHGKLESLTKLLACMGRSTAGVPFDSVDGRPTYLFFMLLAPGNSTGQHLKALARISRLFKDSEFRSRLLRAKDAAALYQTIADEDAKY